jgi:hypothetical protein
VLASAFAPTRIAISPNFASDKTIYFGTQNGKIFRSKDSGEHCSVISPHQLYPFSSYITKFAYLRKYYMQLSVNLEYIKH